MAERGGHVWLTKPQRARLAHEYLTGANEAELLEMLVGMCPGAMRSAVAFAELMHHEFDVPLDSARRWCHQWHRFAAFGISTEELAELCWRWFDQAFNSEEAPEVIMHSDDEALRQQVNRAAMGTSTQTRRARFLEALPLAYARLGLPQPKVIWTSGLASAQLLLYLFRDRISSGEGLAHQLSERRFAGPAQTELERVQDAALAALREFMPAACDAYLPRYLYPDVLGHDVTNRVRNAICHRAVHRLQPVISKRAALKVQQHAREAIRSARDDELDAGIRGGRRDHVRRLLGIAGWGDNEGLPGLFWQDHAPDAAISRYLLGIGVDPVPKSRAAVMLALGLIENGFWGWFGEKVAICCDGPVETDYGAERPLHNPRRPVEVYADGTRVCVMQGFAVPESAVLGKITLAEIEGEFNAEVRRILTEVYGYDRYLRETAATVIDMDMIDVVRGDASFGSMPRALLQDRDGNRWLIGTDGSTRRVYYMPVPREARTCSEAHNALAGFDEDNIIASS